MHRFQGVFLWSAIAVQWETGREMGDEGKKLHETVQGE